MATTAHDVTEAEKLRAERDRLRTEVETLQRKTRHRGWWRGPVAVLLVFLSCVSFLAAVPGVWARRNFLDTNRFVERVAPLVNDPAVQDALTTRLTAEIMVLIDPKTLFEEVLPERGQILAAPLSSAVAGFVRDRVSTFVQSDQFAVLWEQIVRVAHQTATRVLKGESQVVTAANGQVTLNLIPVIDAVLKAITSTSPEILGRQVQIPDVSVSDIPQSAIDRLDSALGVNLGSDFGQLTVYDDGKLETAQTGIRLFDRGVVLLLLASILFAGLALWVSKRRRRTLLQLSVGVIVGMVLVRRIAFRFDDDLIALPPTEQGRAAAAVVVNAFLDPLMTFAAWAIAVAGIVAVVAAVTGPYAWAVSLRRGVVGTWNRVVSTTGEQARDEATVTWVNAHRDVLLGAGGVAGLLLLWAVDLSWLGLLLVLAIVVAFEVAVYRIAASVAVKPS